VQIACLPPYEGYPREYNESTYAAGWGADDPAGDEMPRVMLNVKLTIYDPIKCSIYSQQQETNWNTQICAGVCVGLEKIMKVVIGV
jgi:hypothetical protein